MKTCRNDFEDGFRTTHWVPIWSVCVQVFTTHERVGAFSIVCACEFACCVYVSCSCAMMSVVFVARFVVTHA